MKPIQEAKKHGPFENYPQKSDFMTVRKNLGQNSDFLTKNGHFQPKITYFRRKKSFRVVIITKLDPRDIILSKNAILRSKIDIFDEKSFIFGQNSDFYSQNASYSPKYCFIMALKSFQIQNHVRSTKKRPFLPQKSLFWPKINDFSSKISIFDLQKQHFQYKIVSLGSSFVIISTLNDFLRQKIRYFGLKMTVFGQKIAILHPKIFLTVIKSLFWG